MVRWSLTFAVALTVVVGLRGPAIAMKRSGPKSAKPATTAAPKGEFRPVRGSASDMRRQEPEVASHTPATAEGKLEGAPAHAGLRQSAEETIKAPAKAKGAERGEEPVRDESKPPAREAATRTGGDKGGSGKGKPQPAPKAAEAAGAGEKSIRSVLGSSKSLTKGHEKYVGKSLKRGSIKVTVNPKAIKDVLETLAHEGVDGLLATRLQTPLMRIDLQNFRSYKRDGFCNYQIQIGGSELRFAEPDSSVTNVILDLRLLQENPGAALAKVLEAHMTSFDQVKKVVITSDDKAGNAFLAKQKVDEAKEGGDKQD
jgi:hypothetical protein